MRSLIFLIAFAPALAAAGECRFTAQRNFDVDAAQLKTVALDLGSTDVVVEGVPGLAKVEVRGTACASEQAWLAALSVAHRVDGERLVVTPQKAPDTGASWLHSSYAYLDLHVRVPANLAVDVRSRSGDASLNGVAAVTFEASSGDLGVQHIAGALTVQVSSGDVHGEDLGSVDVRGTGSGDIRLRSVRGDVQVARSGSGDLTFDDVRGAVRIGRVGSGEVEVSRTGGDVSIDSIGSGDVNVNAIGGNFSVHAKGSGDIAHREVRGVVSVPQGED